MYSIQNPTPRLSVLYQRSLNLDLIQGWGTQIWIGRGCVASSSRPMFRGIFSKNRYPYLGMFKKKVPISCDFATKTQNFRNFLSCLLCKLQEILKIKPIVRDSFSEKCDPCVGISCKKKKKKDILVPHSRCLSLNM